MNQITRYQYLQNKGKLTVKVELDDTVVTQQGLALSPFTLVQNQMQAGNKSQPIRVMDNKVQRSDFPLEENDLANSFHYVKSQSDKRKQMAKVITDKYTEIKNENE